jgi:hypothetical protein
MPSPSNTQAPEPGRPLCHCQPREAGGKHDVRPHEHAASATAIDRLADHRSERRLKQQ